MSELVSVEDAWARLSTHLDWADRFWIAFVFTDDPRVIEALGQQAQAQLSAAGRGFVSLRPSKSEAIDEVFEALLGGEKAAVAWVDLVRHDAPSRRGSWQAAWERLMLRLNERRELLRRQWAKGGIVFATTLDRFDETAAQAPDLWTIRAMALRVGSLPAEPDIRTKPPGQTVVQSIPSVRSPELARHAVERALERGDDLGRLEALVVLAHAKSGAELLDVAREARALAERLSKGRTDHKERSRIAASLERLAEALLPSGMSPWRVSGSQAQGARELAERAAEIWRELAQTNSDTYLPGLASALHDFGARLASSGREEGLMVLQEAVGYYRDLARASPDRYLAELASALGNLGYGLYWLRRPEEAIVVLHEAIEHCRKLVDQSPESHLPKLAAVLYNLGVALSSAGRREEAVAALQEAIEYFRKLHLPSLAGALSYLGTELSRLGRGEEALVAAREAIEQHQKLLEAASPDGDLYDMVEVILWFQHFLSRGGDYALVRDCLVDGLRALLVLEAKLPKNDWRLTRMVARNLHEVSRDHGVSIPDDLAPVVAQMIAERPASRG